MSEVQRLASVAPLADHQNKDSVRVKGFTFSPNSTFMSNLHFIMRNPKHFDSPEDFKPERFISEDGR